MRFAALALLTAAAAAPEAAAQSQHTFDRDLEISGFVMKPANTAKAMARLKTVPARRFVARTKNGVRYFIYADPVDCRCAFIGSQTAFDAFRTLTSPGSLPPGYRAPADVAPASGINPMHEVVHDMNEDLDSVDADDIFHPGF